MASTKDDLTEGSVQSDGEKTGAAKTSDKETTGAEAESISPPIGTGIVGVEGPQSP